jgi:hypothetical protein
VVTPFPFPHLRYGTDAEMLIICPDIADQSAVECDYDTQLRKAWLWWSFCHMQKRSSLRLLRQ